MKNLILILLSAVLLSAAPAVSSSDKQDVLAAMDAYKNALIHKDRAALDRLLGNDLTYVHSGGKFETKADVLKLTSVIENIVFFPDTTVRMHGNIALVTGKADFVHSSTATSHVHVLYVWEKGSQGWQMIARQASKRPD
jgi:ketosteroid isomerase-like protein